MLSLAIYTGSSLQYFPSLVILYSRLQQLECRFLIADTVPLCYVSTGRQPDLGGVLSDCHLLSCAGVSPKGLQPILIRDGTLQHVFRGTATLQPVRSCKQNTQVMNKGSRRALVELLLLGIQGKEVEGGQLRGFQVDIKISKLGNIL